MFNFFRLLKKKKFLLLLIFLNIFSDEESFRINQDIELSGSVYVEGVENLSGNLNCYSIKIPFGNINCSKNLTLRRNIKADKLETKNSILVKNINLSDFKLEALNLNLNSNSNINFGNSSSGKFYLDSDRKNSINLGLSTGQINLGGPEVLDFKILNKKDGSSSIIKFVSNRISCDIKDFEGLQKTSLIRIDSNGCAGIGTTSNQMAVDYQDAQFEEISSSGEINLLGTFSTDENSKVLIGSSKETLNIGKGSDSVKFLGQWNFIAENINIGNLENISTTVGDVLKEKLVRLNDFFGNGSLYIFENKNSIILPENEDEFYMLKIAKNGSILTEIPSEKDKNISLNNVETLNLEVDGNLFLNSSDKINLGNGNTENIYIKNMENCLIETNNLNLTGGNFVIENLSNNFSGLRNLIIDRNGIIKDLKEDDISKNLDVNDLTVSGELEAMNVYANINPNQNADINMGTNLYSGNISIGNQNIDKFLVDGKLIEFVIENNVNNKILLGNRSNIKEILLKTDKNNLGKFNISGGSFIFDSFVNRSNLNRASNNFEKINATFYSLGVMKNPRINEVPDCYNVIICAFLLPEVDSTNNVVDRYKFRLAPPKWDEEEYIEKWSNIEQAMVKVKNENFIGTQIKNVNSTGKQKVLLSIGGETTIDLKTGIPLIFNISSSDQVTPLTEDLISLIDKYGFEGLDIDIEAEAITACNGNIFGEIIKNVCDHYRNKGIDFWLTCAMEYPYLSKSNGKSFYRDLISYLGKDYFTYFWPQLYNQYASLNLVGNDSNNYQVANLNDCSAVDGMEKFAPQAVWAFTTNEGAAANPDLDILPFPSEKFVIGIPASGAGAPGIYLGDPATSGADRKIEDYACVRTEAQIIKPENVKAVWDNVLNMNSTTAGFMNWELVKDVDNAYAFGKSAGNSLGIPFKDSVDPDDEDIIEVEKTNGRYLGIDKNKKLYFYGANWADDELFSNAYFSKVNLEDFDGAGLVYIGNSVGNTIINGETLKIGDELKTDDINFNCNFLFLSNNLKLKTAKNGLFTMGNKNSNGETDLYLGSNNRIGNLILSMDDLVLASPGGKLYLFIDKDGNVLSKNKIKTGSDANGNFEFNVDNESDEYLSSARFNLNSDFVVNIESKDDLIFSLKSISNKAILKIFLATVEDSFSDLEINGKLVNDLFEVIDFKIKAGGSVEIEDLDPERKYNLQISSIGDPLSGIYYPEIIHNGILLNSGENIQNLSFAGTKATLKIFLAAVEDSFSNLEINGKLVNDLFEVIGFKIKAGGSVEIKDLDPERKYNLQISSIGDPLLGIYYSQIIDIGISLNPGENIKNFSFPEAKNKLFKRKAENNDLNTNFRFLEIRNKSNTNKNIKFNASDGQIKLLSSSIDLSNVTTPINLYVDDSGFVCADVNKNYKRKENKSIKIGINSLKKLNPKIFNYKNLFLLDSKEDAGFIAEDLLGTEFENCIVKNDEGEIVGINYDSLFSGICSNYKDFITNIENLKKIMNKNKQKILNLIEV